MAGCSRATYETSWGGVKEGLVGVSSCLSPRRRSLAGGDTKTLHGAKQDAVKLTHGGHTQFTDHSVKILKARSFSRRALDGVGCLIKNFRPAASAAAVTTWPWHTTEAHEEQKLGERYFTSFYIVQQNSIVLARMTPRILSWNGENTT